MPLLLSPFRHSRLLVIALLGFSSGLPLALTSSTLQAWFTVAGVNIVTIGALGLIGQPYLYKFLWAPLLDRYVPPFLGRRRGWLVLTQFGLVLAIAALPLADPRTSAGVLVSIALIVAFFSATQDMAIDAYRTEILTAAERGLGSALYIGGYRVAMLASGGLSLIIAGLLGWQVTYWVMAALMAVGLLASYWGKEPQLEGVHAPTTLRTAVIEPWCEFLQRKSALALLAAIILYKLGDALSISLTTPFLIRFLGFSLITVGTVWKGAGLVATLIGVFLAGIMMLRLSLARALLIFGVLQSAAILFFIQLAVVGKSYTLLVLTVFVDNLCNGLGSTALVALIMSLCDVRYTAAQFALLSALAALARVFMSPLAGIMVTHMSWASFFLWALVISLPGLLLIYYLRHEIDARSQAVGTRIEKADF